MSDAHTSPMNVAVVTETYPPEINGVAHTLSKLVGGLIERGHHVTVYRPKQGKDDTPQRHSRLKEHLLRGAALPGYKGLHFGFPATGVLKRHWTDSRPDALYIATEGPLGISARRLAEKMGIAQVTGFHTNFDYYSRYYGVGFLEKPIDGFLRRFHNRSDATLVPTKAMHEKLRLRGYSNTRVLSRGVDTELFSPNKRSQSLRQQWGLTESDIAILYVGRIAAEKNLKLAVKAFEAIKAKRPDARFVLVGDGPMARALQQEHSDYVFCGMRTGEDLAAHYASGDIFLFPSKSETYGNVVLEALASGLPVVSHDYAAAREHVTEGENGCLAPFGDSDAFIKQAVTLSCHPSVKELSHNARKIALNEDWSNIHDRFEAILREHLR